MRENSEALESFVEDVPVLMVVTIAVMIFLAGAGSAYTSYWHTQRQHDLLLLCQTYALAIRSDASLIYEGKEGVFDLLKLQSLNKNWLQRKYALNKYGLSLIITDVSNYPSRYHFEWQTSKPGRQDIYAVTFPVLIHTNRGDARAALMYVALWEVQ